MEISNQSSAHSAGVAHGDLKTENFFISSWSHSSEDDPSEFSFFFESDRNRHRCYLAPERFGRGGGTSRGHFSRELAAMDIFSLGFFVQQLTGDVKVYEVPAAMTFGEFKHQLQGSQDCDVEAVRRVTIVELILEGQTLSDDKRTFAEEGIISGTTVQLLFSIDWVECETQQEAASKKVLPEKLKAVTLPGTARQITEKAFKSCGSLVMVSIPDGITDVGAEAFRDCRSLASDVPVGVARIGDYAFASCDSLATIGLGSALTEIGAAAFAKCTSLRSSSE
eukprot:g15845.t1